MEIHKKESVLSFWLPLILAILIYCLGDVFLKKGNMEIGSFLGSLIQGDFWIAFISNVLIIFAILFAIVSKLIMGVVLSRNPLGLSEGIFLALTAILSFIFGITFFNEIVTFMDVIAIGIIAIGISIIYYGENDA